MYLYSGSCLSWFYYLFESGWGAGPPVCHSSVFKIYNCLTILRIMVCFGRLWLLDYNNKSSVEASVIQLPHLAYKILIELKNNQAEGSERLN